jgi:hypothetical protein
MLLSRRSRSRSSSWYATVTPIPAFSMSATVSVPSPLPPRARTNGSAPKTFFAPLPSRYISSAERRAIASTVLAPCSLSSSTCSSCAFSTICRRS